jgi:hypothetical protein
MAKIDCKLNKAGSTPRSKDINQIRRDVINTLIDGYQTNKTVLK